ncbi:MAG: hypothetical protein FJX31_03840 [Alphaproteobacteria bacterium]|nr:hypothetical protein [Alphaproteobacteria bacterium]
MGGHLLGIAPWTQWLTPLFQVMPLFLLVGGFSDGMSWAATMRSGGNWPDWFASRVRRLIAPVLPLFLVWTLFALFGTAVRVERGIVKTAAQMALIPVWFLAVYLIVTALTPLTYSAWARAGLLSVAVPVAGTVKRCRTAFDLSRKVRPLLVIASSAGAVRNAVISTRSTTGRPRARHGLPSARLSGRNNCLRCRPTKPSRSIVGGAPFLNHAI